MMFNSKPSSAASGGMSTLAPVGEAPHKGGVPVASSAAHEVGPGVTGAGSTGILSGGDMVPSDDEGEGDAGLMFAPDDDEEEEEDE